MLIDTHTHLFSEAFEADRLQAVQRALAAGVGQMLLPNIDLDSIEPMLELNNTFQDACLPMLGLHPCSVTAEGAQEVEKLLKHFRENIYCAVGEIGLDFYWDTTYAAEQEKVFRRQLEFAIEKELPVAIHTRDSFKEALGIVREYYAQGLSGVFHCFSTGAEDAEALLPLERFYYGIGGVITFKNSDLSAIIKDIPLKRILLETDSPYLAPVPHRGKRNESAYLPLIAEAVALAKGISLEEVESVTTENARRLFKL